MKGTAFFLDDLMVEPTKNLVHLSSGPQTLQPRLMDVLVALSARQGEVVSADELVELCWPDKTLGDNPVHKCIAELRRALGDDARNARFIKTVPRKGYMIVANVSDMASTDAKGTPFWLDTSPFPGNRPYEVSEAPIFFGRRQVLEDLKAQIASLAEHKCSWLVLRGAARCGMSSLLHAGLLPLVPRLKAAGCRIEKAHLLDFRRHTGVDANDIILKWLLDERLLDRGKDLSFYQGLLQSCLDGDEGARDLLDVYLGPSGPEMTPKQRHLLVLDHLEAVASTPEQSGNMLFGFLLKTLSMSRHYVLVTAIKPQIMYHHAGLAEHLQAAQQYSIPDFNPSELREVICQSAMAAGLSFDYDESARESLDAKIAEEIAHQAVPIGAIQCLLQHLYSARTLNRLTFREYRRTGGVAGFLAKKADAALRQASEDERAALQEIFFHVTQLSPTGEGLVPTPPVSCQSVGTGPCQTLIDRLISSDALRASAKDGNALVQLSHTGLLVHWQWLADWSNDNIDGFYARHDLKVAAERWQRHQQQDHYLGIAKTTVAKARTMASRTPFALGDKERSFLQKSEQKYSRRNGLRAAIAGVMTVAVLGLAGLSYSIDRKNTQLRETRQTAESLISSVLHDLKDKLEPIDKLELIEIVGVRAQEYFESAGTSQLTGVALTQWVEALNIMGKVRVEKLDYAQARQFFLSSQSVLDNAPAHFRKMPGFLEQAMITSYWLGYIPFKQGAFADAQPHWQAYLDIADQLVAQDSSSSKWQREKSYALTNLGSLAEKTGQLEEAAAHLEASAALKRGILETEPGDVATRSSLANTLSWQATTLMKSGSLHKARDIYQNALSEALQLSASMPENFRRLRQVALLKHRLALVTYDLGELAEASEHAASSQEILARLMTNDPENRLYKQRMLWSLLLRSKVLRHRSEIDGSLEQIQQAEALLDSAKAAEMPGFVSLLQQEQARLFHSMGQIPAALVMINRALDMHRRSTTDTVDAVLVAAELLATKSQMLGASDRIADSQLIADIEDTASRMQSLTTAQKTPRANALLVTIAGLTESGHTTGRLMQKLELSGYRNPDYLTFVPQGDATAEPRKLTTSDGGTS